MSETQFLINHIEQIAAYAHIWGFFIVFILMAVESSFFPFPSEVIMIPAGFLACRGELTFGVPLFDLSAVIILGLLGSLAGAFFNYYFALLFGRPFLHKYGKYFFIKRETLERAEELFRKYGEITTFICRLIPAVRQLISLPAGISKMSIPKFAFFTGLGAGLWSAVLALIGYSFGELSKEMTYPELIYKGKELIVHNYIWLFAGIAVLIAVYIFVHKKIIGAPKAK
ncbi:MAG: DedA family protein [Victivallales bacterium]|nr:DedA family protein [Victivallales bacterium]MCF7888602.1 DedA family protein [Victivallales bacterium]